MSASASRSTFVVVLVPIRTVSESNVRTHWAVRAKRTHNQRGLVRLLLSPRRGELRLPAQITLVRIAPRTLDDDNARGATKAIRDGVADVFGLPDNDPRFTWHYDQRRGKAREYAVEVRIEMLPW